MTGDALSHELTLIAAQLVTLVGDDEWGVPGEIDVERTPAVVVRACRAAVTYLAVAVGTLDGVGMESVTPEQFLTALGGDQ